jgi:hypothetical protein
MISVFCAVCVISPVAFSRKFFARVSPLTYGEKCLVLDLLFIQYFSGTAEVAD